MQHHIKLVLSTTLLFLCSTLATAQTTPITLTLSPNPSASPVAPLFLGLSYESREILPKNGRYYFDPDDQNLVHIYQTLGIKSLRVGANAVDDPKVPVPDTKEIDHLFTFARKAGVKVIYSFRLKNGDPANAARLADYINKNYADTLDCFCIGNEPDFYLKTYDGFCKAWTPIYDAILKAVPNAKFEGPATAHTSYALQFGEEFFPKGHLAMVSTHTYPLGNGREAEKNPSAARARFVSNKPHAGYQRLYDTVVKPLAEKNIPYRLDETNSCFRGGAKDASDTYASTLWALHYLNFWASHNILGLNFHTGDTVNGIPPMAANYAVFVHNDNSSEFDVRPIAYACLAFSQAVHGKPMSVQTEGSENIDFAAYAYQDDAGDESIVLLNKTFATNGKDLAITITGTPASSHARTMVLQQHDSDFAAKSNITLGNGSIDPKGAWTGTWSDLPITANQITLTLKPASAILLRLTHN